MTTVIRGARVFTSGALSRPADVRVAGACVDAIGDGLAGDDMVDGDGCTLLPGLIDAHVHTRPPDLAQLAIAFGVTTILDMGSEPHTMVPYRALAATRNDLADIRTSSSAATPAGGHPAPLVGLLFDGPLPALDRAEDAPAFVDARLDEGADYIKLVIEDGTMLGGSMPAMAPAVSDAVVAAAHARGRIAVAHVHTQAAAWQAVRSGVDALMHLFLDGPVDDALIGAIADRGVAVAPTLTLLQAMTGTKTGAELAQDGRVTPFLSDAWRENLRRAWRFATPGRYEYAVEATRRLRSAGVRLLAGTDCACLGVVGTAPGVSLHRELQLLVEDAGLTPPEALAAATAGPAAVFGLEDRGRVAVGAQADLVLVEGDPTTRITDTLSIRGVWRRGEALDRGYPA